MLSKKQIDKIKKAARETVISAINDHPGAELSGWSDALLAQATDRDACADFGVGIALLGDAIDLYESVCKSEFERLAAD